jgi:hypothetical protein
MNKYQTKYKSKVFNNFWLRTGDLQQSCTIFSMAIATFFGDFKCPLGGERVRSFV